MKETIFTAWAESISYEIIRWIKSRRDILKITGKIFIVIILTLSASYPLSAWNLILRIANWQNALILWFFNFYFIIFFIYPLVMKQYHKDMQTPLFFGVKLEEIATYILKTGKFPRDEVVRKFGVSRAIAQEMIDKLDEVGIFVRGENNVRRVDINLSTIEKIIERLSSPTQEVVSEKSEYIENCDIDAEQTDSEQSAEVVANDNGWTCKRLASS